MKRIGHNVVGFSYANRNAEPDRLGRGPASRRSSGAGARAYFSDPLALRILGKDAESVAREAEEHPFRRIMRIFIAVRTRLRKTR
jgi:hypothetical protein